ncbi:MAG TPA: hypothetical protein VK424_08385 [Thermoplasmata archaeon]|nr:hypothetical protein [Thermoplasmata archaeon]
MGGGYRAGTSPSDLADYAYCPRSHWYRHHPPAGGPSEDGRRRSSTGERYHRETLRGTRVRAEFGAAYTGLIAAGILLAAVGIVWLLF